MQIFVRDLSGRSLALDVAPASAVGRVKELLSCRQGIPPAEMSLVYGGKMLADDARPLSAYGVRRESTLHLALRLLGGIDFQNRHGSKPGAGSVSQAQEQIDRKERLRKLAMETIDLSKDPYFMRNHLGTYECKLCLTLHNTEGNYLAHTQGKRHQTNLARRAAREARDAPALPAPLRTVAKKNVIKIGRPGYQVMKQKDPETGQKSLTFEIAYPEIEAGLQPRHRFMSAYEQKVEAPDKRYQYLLFAADPYETIAFKVPNVPIDKGEGKFTTQWTKSTKTFRLQLHFKTAEAVAEDNLRMQSRGAPRAAARRDFSRR